MQREDHWQLATYSKIPLVLVEGRGCWVTDVQGRRFLDLYGGHCVASVGHCHPRLVQAVQDQAARLLFYSNAVYSDVRAEAAEKVASLAPEGLRRVFFCNSGSEANETALKIARRHTGRRRIVAMREGFHGRTLGSLAVTGLPGYLDPSWPVPTDDTTWVPYGDVEALDAALGDDVAAVLLEPIPSMGGVQVAAPGYFERLRESCGARGALLVFDEVQTGFGRTGTPFFGEGVGVVPDLITAAKGAAGGVPAGVVFVREDVAAGIGSGEQGTTFGGGPLACAALAATADILRDEGLCANAAAQGAWLTDELLRVPGVRAVHGRGLLLGVDLDRDAKPVIAALREAGILVGSSKPKAQMRLLPPLVLEREEAGLFVDALRAILT
ncbi:MAG: aspartate aminotransferase family protein [Planctomycetes bacterium]|nr:aspartate aminotransferase family protein [Planctomycetota bacterium]